MTAVTASRAGPRWTYRRLRLVLGVTFGINSRGRPDTAAAAAALGVTPRTVQRWLHGNDRALARVPAARLEQIQRAVRPDPESLRQEKIATRYARTAIDRLARPDSAGVMPAWRQRRWLEPHLVAVLELPGLGLRQVTLSRASDRTLAELRKRGKVITHTTVRTRFHGIVLANTLLERVDAWRVTAPPPAVKQGRTLTWLASAPGVRLPDLARHTGLAVTHVP